MKLPVGKGNKADSGAQQGKKTSDEKISPPKVHMCTTLHQTEQPGEKGERHHRLRLGATAPEGHQRQGSTEHEVSHIIVLITIQMVP